jgi:hypothetical protein
MTRSRVSRVRLADEHSTRDGVICSRRRCSDQLRRAVPPGQGPLVIVEAGVIQLDFA